MVGLLPLQYSERDAALTSLSSARGAARCALLWRHCGVPQIVVLALNCLVCWCMLPGVLLCSPGLVAAPVCCSQVSSPVLSPCCWFRQRCSGELVLFSCICFYILVGVVVVLCRVVSCAARVVPPVVSGAAPVVSPVVSGAAPVVPPVVSAVAAGRRRGGGASGVFCVARPGRATFYYF